MDFTSRLAVAADVPALMELMDAAIAELQRGFLDDAQIESSRAIMGIDTSWSRTARTSSSSPPYELAGCGGWSRRATLYGGHQTPAATASSSIPPPSPLASARCTRAPHTPGEASGG